jgi:hypothetical protein
MILGPNRARRADAKKLLHEIIQETGEISLKERLFGLATIPLAGWTWLTTKLNILQQPQLLRIEYPATPVYKPEPKTEEQKTISPVTITDTGTTCPICSLAAESENAE